MSYHPQRPVDTHNMLTPPPSTKNTMYGQNSTSPSPTRSALRSPMPNQIVPFDQSMYQSPQQMPSQTQYPTSITSQAPQGYNFEDPAFQREILLMMREKAQQQQQQRGMRAFQPHQQMPPNTIPQGPSFSPQQHWQPYNPQQQYQSRQQDSGYWSQGSTDNFQCAGAFFGVPGQQPRAQHGHEFGLVKAKGRAKVILGNVYDGNRPDPLMNKGHKYTGAELEDDAQANVGNHSMEAMRTFYRGP